MHEGHLLRRDVLRGASGGFLFVQCDEVLDQVPALDLAAYHVDVAVCLIRAHEPEDVGVIAVGEELDLGERAGAAGGRAVRADVGSLDGHLRAGLLAHAGEDDTLGVGWDRTELEGQTRGRLRGGTRFSWQS